MKVYTFSYVVVVFSLGFYGNKLIVGEATFVGVIFLISSTGFELFTIGLLIAGCAITGGFEVEWCGDGDPLDKFWWFEFILII